ncbi:MAG: hypothetical protein ACI81I_000637 [Arcobacteraceae bacterium]|jgi:hypothetical protein
MNNKKYFLKKISNYAIVGGLGATLITSFTACEDKNGNAQGSQNNSTTNSNQKQGAFVIIEKNAKGGYQIIDEFPSTKTTIILRENGNERILSQGEIDLLVRQESIKIDNGTSNLTNDQVHSGGRSLGETILASAAGFMIGSYIGNKLFNNNNYQSQRRTNYKSPSTYSKSVNSFNKVKSASARSTSTTKRSGFFSGSRSSSRRGFGGFFGG